jgi:AcrR family transcriptional regulator
MNDSKKKLLQAATLEISEKGFEKANVNHIAEAADLSVGTLYNHFPTKRNLMHAIIDESSQLHVAHIVDSVMLASDPISRMKAFFDAGFAFIEANIIASKIVFNTLNGSDEDFKQRLFKAYLPLFELLSREVIGPGESQKIFQNLDQKRIVNLIMFIYLGTGSQFDDEGKLWMKSTEVSTFVLNALRYKEGT